MNKELKDEIINSISETTKTMLILSKILLVLMDAQYIPVHVDTLNKVTELSKSNKKLVNKLKEN